MVACACNASLKDSEQGILCQVIRKSGLNNDIHARLDYRVRPLKLSSVPVSAPYHKQ